MVVRLYLAVRGKAALDTSLCFFVWLAHVSCELAERILSSLSADKRSPEGLGLDGIRGASYALDVPAKQKRWWFTTTTLRLANFQGFLLCC